MQRTDITNITDITDITTDITPQTSKGYWLEKKEMLLFVHWKWLQKENYSGFPYNPVEAESLDRRPCSNRRVLSNEVYAMLSNNKFTDG